MTDWWNLFHSALWISGLALGLAVLSVVEYQAEREKVRLRQKLNEPGPQLLLDAGMVLICLGLMLSAGMWWLRVAWGALALVFMGRAAWLWRQGQIPVAASVQPEPVAARASVSHRRDVSWLGWGLILTGLLISIGWGVIAGRQVFDHTRSLQSHLHGLEQLAQGNADHLEIATLQSAGQHLSGMHQDLEAIRSQVGPFLLVGRLFRWVPKHGGDLAAAADLMETAVQASSAGDRAFQALSPALAPAGGTLKDDLGTELQSRLLPALVEAHGELETARRELAVAAQARDRIDTQSLSPQVAVWLDRADRYVPLLGMALDGALLAPALLGEDGPRTYLVLAQNNHELRATGGFISGVGEMRIENGRLTSLQFGDSYAVDNLEAPHELAPPAMQQTLLAQLWFFRDTNWDADFPTSARRALDIYARDQGVQASGVLTLDLAALQLLMEVVGPVQVEGIVEPVTSENLQRIILEQWAAPSAGAGQEQGQDWWQHRKDFMGQIADAILERLLTGQDVQTTTLLRTLARALDEKHLLVYLADPNAAALLHRQGWDGALPASAAPTDALLVADSNVGFNKADAKVNRSLNYLVDLSREGKLRARVTLTYQHGEPRPGLACIQESRYSDTYANMMDRCYWDYVRVYTPPGSRLIEGPDLPLPSGSLWARNSGISPSPSVSATLVEEGRPVWAAFFDLAPGAEQTLAFEYELPPEALALGADGLYTYRLRVQKQPGTQATPLQVEVTLPPDAKLVDATPVELLSSEGTRLTVSTDLSTDREFVIVFRREEESP